MTMQKTVSRWQSAFENSIKGLRYGVRTETAMREEVIALCLAVPAATLLADSLWQWMLLVFSVAFLLLVETLNTAIELTLDRVSEEPHELTGAAKDLGSLAVLIALMMVSGAWGWVVYQKFV